MRQQAPIGEEKTLCREPADSSTIYSASLKLAWNVIDAGFPGFAIVAVLVGIEDLLEVLFSELCEHGNWSTKKYLAWEYGNKSKNRKYNNDKESFKKLTVFGWLELYKDAKLLDKLERQFGYTLNELNVDNLHEIRTTRNTLGHSLTELVHQANLIETAERIVQSYERILIETERIMPTAALVTINDAPNSNSIALQRIEKETLSLYFDSVLRSNPNDSDFHFLRQFLTKIPTVEAGNLGMIPERNRDQNSTHMNLNMTKTCGRLGTESSTLLIQVLNIVQNKINISVNLGFPKLSRWERLLLLIVVIVVIVVAAFTAVIIALVPGIFEGIFDLIGALLALVREFVGELISGNPYAIALIVLPLAALTIRVVVPHLRPRRKKTRWEKFKDLF